jgi:WD40 repeat protein
MHGHPGDVVSLSFSPDNKKLASASSSRDDECAVRIWDVATASASGMLGGPNPGVWGVSYTPDGKMLAFGGWDRTLHVVELATNVEKLNASNIGTRLIRALAISPDGKTIAAGGSGPTRLWDLNSGKELPVTFPEMCPSFFPDSKRIAGWYFRGGRIIICDVFLDRIDANWSAHPKTIEGLAISPDGRHLVSLGNDGLIKLWSVADQKEIARLVGHTGNGYSAAFSPDGKRLATTGYDDATVRIWDLPPECFTQKP